jgi:spore coat polysaccharide biosynthesis protein SpsF (cytidylyltransferase family)
MTRIVALVQARMGSTRLPGKVLKDILGKPMLWHVINRLKKATLIDEIAIVTTTKERDKQIIKFAKENGIKSFAGSEADVLDRYYKAAVIYKAEVIVRITADCPLIDPDIVNKTIKYFSTNNFDYVSSARALTVRAGVSNKQAFPDGLDVEVFSFAALEKAWKEAKSPSDREHVTTYIWRNDELFKTAVLECDEDLSHLRWTVDNERDLVFVRTVYKELYKTNESFGLKDILAFLEKKPKLLWINKGALRNEGYFKSLERDPVEDVE